MSFSQDLARRQQELERLEAAKRERMAQVAARRGEMPSSMMNNNLPGQGGPPQVGLGGPNAPSSGPQMSSSSAVEVVAVIYYCSTFFHCLLFFISMKKPHFHQFLIIFFSAMLSLSL